MHHTFNLGLLENTRGLACGKVMLFGEYSVLEGAPALLVGTAQKAEAQFYPFEHPTAMMKRSEATALFDQASHLHATPRYLIDGVQLGYSLISLDSNGDDFLTTGENFELIREALICLNAPAGLYQIDTSRFGVYQGEEWVKMGIGSSGAATASLIDLFGRSSTKKGDGGHHLETKEGRFKFACEVHTRGQGGLGSGADVATSVYGGLIKYQRSSGYWARVIPIRQSLPNTWGIWRGGSTSTVRALRSLASWRSANESSYQSLMKRLSEPTLIALDALESPQVCKAQWIEAVTLGAQVMREFSAETGIHAWTERHEQWSSLIKPLGGVLKPTGAGGDDLSLFTADSAESAKRCLERLKQHSLECGEQLLSFAL